MREMLRKVNAQGLMDLIRANEEADKFDLGKWLHPCGTYGCLAGNYEIARRKRLGLPAAGSQDFDYRTLAVHFSISPAESVFLFTPWNLLRQDGRGLWMDACGMPTFDTSSRRNCEDRSVSLSRVRKFLYYKLRKWELLYEEDGSVRESSRRAEGDHHVCRNVLQAV